MRRFIDLIEKYTADNSYLLQHLRDPQFDPHQHWNELRIWFEEHPDEIELLSELTGKDYADADEINEDEPDIFYKLPPEVQKEAAEWVIEWLMRHDPAEAPSHAHMSLKDKQLLPRTTWLIHFTDSPDAIAEKGFTIGMGDMSKLGLTTYYKNTSFDKQYGGYNFAFIADSRHAKWAASEHKYGRHAVMFQNSGVRTYHYADEEDQVIFYGKDVDPRSIIILREGWTVEARRQTRRGSELFEGDFEACVAWVERNARQYWRYLTGY